MSEPVAEPTPSLIQQRLDLGRRRIAALIMMIAWGAFTIIRAFDLDVGDVWDWLAFAGMLAFALYGVKLWFDYRRKRRAFEERYGRDAGRQK